MLPEDRSGAEGLDSYRRATSSGLAMIASINSAILAWYCSAGDQVLLAAMREDVDQAPHLGLLLVAHQDRLISAREDLVPPAGRSGDLARELRVEIAHEAGQALAVLHSNEKVEMPRREEERADFEREEALRPAESADDDLVEQWPRPQEESAVNRAAGDLVEGSPLGRESDLPGHFGSRASQEACQARRVGLTHRTRAACTDR